MNDRKKVIDKRGNRSVICDWNHLLPDDNIVHLFFSVLSSPLDRTMAVASLATSSLVYNLSDG